MPLERVKIPKQKFLSVSKDVFIKELASSFELENDELLFNSLANALQHLFDAYRVEQRETVKSNYSCFNLRNEFSSQEVSKLSTEELQNRQNALLLNIYDILNDSNFEAITCKMYKNALESVYLSDLPIVLDYPRLDGYWLLDFFKKYPHLNPYKDSTPPPFFKHFILFFRGIGLKTNKELFISHKINLITADIQRYFSSLLKYVFKLMIGKLFGGYNVKQDRNNDVKTIEDKSEDWSRLENLSSSKSKNSDNNSINNINTKHYVRKSLTNTYKEARANGISGIIYWLLSNTKLLEPTFNNLVLVYREFEESLLQKTLRHNKERLQRQVEKVEKRVKQEIKKQKQNSNNSMSKSIYNEMNRRQSTRVMIEPKKESSILGLEDSYKQPIRIQYFSSVPMADLEIVFPCKRLSLKTFDKIYFYIIILLGIYTLFIELFSNKSSKVGYMIAIGAIVLMIRTITWYRGKEDLYNATLNETLYECNMSQDESVLLNLIDECNTQDLKESILAYYIIHKNNNNNNLDCQTIDKMCEEFVKKKFKLNNINIEIKDCIRKLNSLGLLKCNDNVLNYQQSKSLNVLSLKDSLNCIKKKWNSITDKFDNKSINSNFSINENYINSTSTNETDSCSDEFTKL